MKATKTTVVAGVLAMAAECMLFLAFRRWGHVGPDGPGDALGAIGLFFHLPGLLLTQSLHLSAGAEPVLMVVTGAIQFFAVFWLGIMLWKRISKRHAV